MVICKSDEEKSLKTGKCVIKCKPPQTRNPITGRCKKMGVVSRPVSWVLDDREAVGLRDDREAVGLRDDREAVGLRDDREAVGLRDANLQSMLDSLAEEASKQKKTVAKKDKSLEAKNKEVLRLLKLVEKLEQKVSRKKKIIGSVKTKVRECEEKVKELTKKRKKKAVSKAVLETSMADLNRLSPIEEEPNMPFFPTDFDDIKDEYESQINRAEILDQPRVNFPTEYELKNYGQSPIETAEEMEVNPEVARKAQIGKSKLRAVSKLVGKLKPRLDREKLSQRRDIFNDAKMMSVFEDIQKKAQKDKKRKAELRAKLSVSKMTQRLRKNLGEVVRKTKERAKKAKLIKREKLKGTREVQEKTKRNFTS